MLTSWFLVSVWFFIFFFYHFPRNDHLSRDKITQKNITTKLLLCWHFLCNIFILVFQVYFLFWFELFSFCFVCFLQCRWQSSDSHCCWGDGGSPSWSGGVPRKKVHSAFCISVGIQKTLVLLRKWANWTLNSTGRLCDKERWMFYLLKKEVLEWEKLEVFFFSSLGRKYIYLFV